MTKDVIFFSNPFGFGPTAKAIALLNVCQNYWDANLHYVTNDDCMQIFNNKQIHIIKANQRDLTEVEKVLSSFKAPYVVSSLNRFAIKIAHDKNIPNCFIDSLTWMWNEIPQDYLLTDLYFALNFPGLDEKIKKYHTLIKVPYIIDTYSPNASFEESDLLINVGGCMNPLTKECPTAFLSLLSSAILELPHKKIIVCGGKEAISFMDNMIKKDNVKCMTLKKEVFLSSLFHSKHFITTSGLNATLEAFKYNIPTSFIMPTNLSQWENLNVFNANSAAPNKVTWEDVIDKDLDIHKKTEKEAIQIISQTANTVLKNPILKNKCVELIKKICTIIPDKYKQSAFVENIGSDGAYVIAKILKEKWRL